MKKKLVAIISTVAMLVTMIPATAFAANGTIADVKNREELENAFKNENVTQINITENIDLKGKPWKPIMLERDLTIKGNNYTISNMKVTDALLKADGTGTPGSGSSCDYYAGFIGNVKGAALTIDELRFEGANVDIDPLSPKSTGSSILAVPVANNQGGTVILNGVVVKNSVVKGYTKVGILHGFTQGNGSFTANKCEVSGNEVVLEADGSDTEAAFSGIIIGCGNEKSHTNGITMSGNTIKIDESVNWGDEKIEKDDASGVVKVGAFYLTSETYVRDFGGNDPVFLVAEVGDYAYETIEAAITAASEGETVTLLKDITTDKKINIQKSITLDLNGNAITASDTFEDDANGNNVIDIKGEGIDVTIKGGTITAGTNTKHVVNIWNAGNITLEGLTLDHTNAETGAPLVVNSADVTVSGSLNLKTGDKSWYGINLDTNAGKATSFELSDNATVKLKGTMAKGANGENAIYIENSDNLTGDAVKVSFGQNTSVDVSNVKGTDGGPVTAIKESPTAEGVKVENPENAGLVYNPETGESSPKPTTPSNPGGGTIITPSVTKDRLAGDDRFETAVKVADQLKKELGVTKFNNVVVTYSDEFADALSATALAADKDAPILLINKNDTATAKDYIAKNLAKNGTVYIIGGTTVVPEDFAKSLTDCKVVRLGGADRYETNMEVLKELKIDSSADIMVASGLKFADALSASATGNPILLVGKNLTTAQKDYLASLGGNDDYYVIGGTVAINATVENQLKESKVGDVARLAGDDRYETSAAVADKFSANARALVIASGADFPDGLTGGVLAAAKNAPLMLVADGYTDYAADFVDDNRVRKVTAIGGTTVMPDSLVNKVA